MAKGWTPERRARQAELIRAGGRGKSPPDRVPLRAAASRNGDKGGVWKAERDNMRAFKSAVAELLGQQRELLRRVIG